MPLPLARKGKKTKTMTAVELYEALKEKGYKPQPCGQHFSGGYCCSEALHEFRDDFTDEPEVLQGWMTQHLELDRRAVFQAWYGPGKWMEPFRAAHEEMVAMVREDAVSYILQHP